MATIRKLSTRRRNKLVEKHMPLARRIARQCRKVFWTPNVELDDLTQWAYFGLVEAATRYRANTGVPFGAFASLRIRGRIFDEFRRRHFRNESFEPLPDDILDERSTANDLAYRNETCDRLAVVLSRLTSDEIRAVCLSVIRGLTQNEVAEAMDVKPHRVGKLLRFS